MTVVQCAKVQGDPYTVLPLTHESFFDFKALARQTMQNTTKNTKKQTVQWLKIKCLRVTKDDRGNVHYKYRQAENFMQLKISTTHPSTRNNPQARVTGMLLPSLYTHQVPITQAKKKDLLKLCTTKVIPAHHHYYYYNLPTSDNTTDCLPDLDVQEENDDTDGQFFFSSSS